MSHQSPKYNGIPKPPATDSMMKPTRTMIGSTRSGSATPLLTPAIIRSVPRMHRADAGDARGPPLR